MQTKKNNFKKRLAPYQRGAFGAGFTLLELLIAIFIFAVGMVGVVAFFSASVENQNKAKNELIAVGLAQEAPEIVRNIVEYNLLNPGTNPSWWTNLYDLPGTASNPGTKSIICQGVDYDSLATSHQCSASAKKNVCLSSDKRYFQCETPIAGQIQTGFTRDLDIRIVHSDGSDCKNINPCDLNDGSGDCLKVTVNVKWSDMTTKAVGIICKPTY